MKVDDELLDGLGAIAVLENLPLPRKGELRRRLIFAQTSEARQKIILDAATESRRNAYRTRAELDRQYQKRADYAALMERAGNASHKPSAAPTGSRRYSERHPEPRPVTTRYVTPTKPAPIQEGAPKTKPVPKPLPEVIQHGEKKNLNHGTTTGYKDGCRCDPCREAKRVSRNPKGTRRPNGEPAPHGTTTNYQRGCRCQECRKAVADYARWKRNQENG